MWCLGLGPETEKWLSGKSSEIQIRTAINVPMLITCLTDVAWLCKMFNFRGNWVKDIWELSMIPLQLGKFKVIPKISLFF